MRRARWLVMFACGCGLFPNLGDLTSDASAPFDASSDVDASTYADVRLQCQTGPCVPQLGEECCWFADASDTCFVPPAACTGFASIECYGTAQCAAKGKEACCALSSNTACTSAATCVAEGGVIICDRSSDSGFGDPSDNACPSPLACNGTTIVAGYASWRACK